jgi:serine/threonine protein kinase
MSGLFRAPSLDEHLAKLPKLPTDPVRIATVLVERGLLTTFQAKMLLAGKIRCFRLGSYVVRDKLGSGAMGTVFLAEHDPSRQFVALKVFHPTAKGGARLITDQFLQEVCAAITLDHPNIVRIHDVVEEGNTQYLVMEYVEGVSLDALLKRGGPIPPSQAVAYIARAATGLQYAYENGFVHGAIKPGNLILSPTGAVKILDMGLAQAAVRERHERNEQLAPGAIPGTVDFVSPEQALGAANIDIRSDVYSLGATFFALVRGHTLFQGNATQKLAQLRSREAPDLAHLDPTFPPKLAAIVAKMLARKPQDRYQTPAEVLAALDPWPPQDERARVGAGAGGADPVATPTPVGQSRWGFREPGSPTHPGSSGGSRYHADTFS